SPSSSLPAALLSLLAHPLITPPPPPPTLFPYTTLFRSHRLSHTCTYPSISTIVCIFRISLAVIFFNLLLLNFVIFCCISCIKTRSEEHTSELQSRFDLVCRLLLEKKKKITN